jgi:hypothetical protein
MMIIISVASNGVFIKQDNSPDCTVFERPNRAPRAAAQKVKQILTDYFASLDEEGLGEPEEDGGEETPGDGE